MKDLGPCCADRNLKGREEDLKSWWRDSEVSITYEKFYIRSHLSVSLNISTRKKNASQRSKPIVHKCPKPWRQKRLVFARN